MIVFFSRWSRSRTIEWRSKKEKSEHIHTKRTSRCVVVDGQTDHSYTFIRSFASSSSLSSSSLSVVYVSRRKRFQCCSMNRWRKEWRISRSFSLNKIKIDSWILIVHWSSFLSISPHINVQTTTFTTKIKRRRRRHSLISTVFSSITLNQTHSRRYFWYFFENSFR